MRTVRINSKNSPVSRSICATPNAFLDYEDIVKDAKSRRTNEADYKAERVIHLTNSTGKQKVFMLIQTTVTVEFSTFNALTGLSFCTPKLKCIADRKVSFYCVDQKNKLEEVNATFGYNGKTLNFDELTQVGNFSPLFIYDDSELSTAIHRSVSSWKKNYKPTIKPFIECFT